MDVAIAHFSHHFIFTQDLAWVDMEPAHFLEKIRLASTISIRNGWWNY